MEQATEILPAPTAAAPDWSNHSEELHCPLCEYNLRGLTEPVCPECGYRFEWRELTDPARRKHPYVFEHHPERNYWSFRKTVGGGLRPTRFWKSLFPTQPSRPRRLVVYWVLTVILSSVGVLGLGGEAWARLERNRTVAMAQLNTPQYNPNAVTASFSALLFSMPVTWESIAGVVGLGIISSWAFLCAWPWLTYLSLLVFRISMRRAKINPSHVLRCVVYSGDSILWAGVGMLLLATIATGLEAAGYPPLGFDVLVSVLLAAAAAWNVYRLWVAYRMYLRFDHPGATILASQIMVGLVAVLCLVPLEWFIPLFR